MKFDVTDLIRNDAITACFVRDFYSGEMAETWVFSLWVLRQNYNKPKLNLTHLGQCEHIAAWRALVLLLQSVWRHMMCLLKDDETQACSSYIP